LPQRRLVQRHACPLLARQGLHPLPLWRGTRRTAGCLRIQSALHAPAHCPAASRNHCTTPRVEHWLPVQQQCSARPTAPPPQVQPKAAHVLVSAMSGRRAGQGVLAGDAARRASVACEGLPLVQLAARTLRQEVADPARENSRSSAAHHASCAPAAARVRVSAGAGVLPRGGHGSSEPRVCTPWATPPMPLCGYLGDAIALPSTPTIAPAAPTAHNWRRIARGCGTGRWMQAAWTELRGSE
jgi:hypothetical protein